jgi:hypothetical protein
MVQGASTWEVEEDELYVYEIKSFDEDLAEDVFVNDDIEDILGEDAEVDAMMAQMITDVDEIDDFNDDATEDDPGWEFEGWRWIAGWTDDEEDFEDPDASDITEYTGIRIPEDPEEYGPLSGFAEVFLLIIITWIGVPSPADDWLDDVDWFSLDPDDETLTLEYDSSSDPTLNEDYEMVWMWDSDGVYQGRQAIVDGDVIYEIALKKSFFERIPGYDFPLFLGFTAVSTIGLIYIMMKKNK